MLADRSPRSSLNPAKSKAKREEARRQERRSTEEEQEEEGTRWLMESLLGFCGGAGGAV